MASIVRLVFADWGAEGGFPNDAAKPEGATGSVTAGLGARKVGRAPGLEPSPPNMDDVVDDVVTDVVVEAGIVDVVLAEVAPSLIGS